MLKFVRRAADLICMRKTISGHRIPTADERNELTYMLRGRHYPPISNDFFNSAWVAVQEVNAYRPDTMITMPNGKTKRAIEIVQALRLDGGLDEHCYNDNYLEMAEIVQSEQPIKRMNRRRDCTQIG